MALVPDLFMSSPFPLLADYGRCSVDRKLVFGCKISVMDCTVRPYSVVLEAGAVAKEDSRNGYTSPVGVTGEEGQGFILQTVLHCDSICHVTT